MSGSVAQSSGMKWGYMIKTKFRPRGQKQKTNGQKLYEWKVKDYHCTVCKTPHGTPAVGWDFLTDKTKESWEKQAVGHHMFTRDILQHGSWIRIQS